MKHTRFAQESAAQAQAEAMEKHTSDMRPHGSDRFGNPCECEGCEEWDARSRAEAREKRTRQPVDRKTVLLKAAYDILKKVKDAPYVESAMEMTAFYDEAECDGLCLMEDIATELDIDTSQ